MLITRLDPFTGKLNEMDLPITNDQIQRWESGELIQNVMPSLNADQREFLMTGIMPDSWATMFEPED